MYSTRSQNICTILSFALNFSLWRQGPMPMCLDLPHSIKHTLALNEGPLAMRHSGQCDVSDPDHNGHHNGKYKCWNGKSEEDSFNQLEYRQNAEYVWTSNLTSAGNLQTLAENKSLWKKKHVMLLGLKTLSLKVPKQSQIMQLAK